MLTQATVKTLLSALEKYEECIRDLDDMAYYHDDPSEPLGIYAAIDTARAEIEAMAQQQQAVWLPVPDHFRYISASKDRIDVGYPTVLRGKSILVVGQDGDNQNTEPIVLPDNIRLCQRAPVVGLDTPDSAGWWAKDYDGGALVNGERQFVAHLTHWEIHGDEVFFKWGTSGQFSNLTALPISEFKRIFGGKWYKLNNMPWDAARG